MLCTPRDLLGYFSSPASRANYWEKARDHCGLHQYGRLGRFGPNLGWILIQSRHRHSYIVPCPHELLKCAWSTALFVNIYNHNWNTWMVSCPREQMQCAESNFLFSKICNHKWNTWMVSCTHELKKCADSMNFFVKKYIHIWNTWIDPFFMDCWNRFVSN